jgi:hypothetical protein
MLFQHAWGLTVEFMQEFLGSAVNTEMSSTLEKKSNDFYVPSDTVYQYLEQFTLLGNLRSKVSRLSQLFTFTIKKLKRKFFNRGPSQT